MGIETQFCMKEIFWKKLSEVKSSCFRDSKPISTLSVDN